MGNTLGAKKTTKVMQIDGKTFKLKTPVKAGDILKDHPGLVLLESEAVKHYGTRAKPLEAHKELEPKRLYFLVELPKETNPRRVRSGINMSAKDRLESLMLTRRSASDLSNMKQRNIGGVGGGGNDDGQGSKENDGGVRLKMRLPKAEVEKLIQECKDEDEVAERIMSLYIANRGRESGSEIEEIGEKNTVLDRVENSPKPREKRVSFMPISNGGIQVAVAS
ncbi:PREDICTED: uncharacterized protein At1g66480-like isoform X3 [Lupinus angustifolius]|uniref:uncharacterized protein At1g66480-like isoform X3 n=1 Tax=Lupinus angustifolius TaxID=3871 RepID=UPI00092E4811|nr:PREDICTED: uncharacterized protein At1g66480-like isoform X3 [Lupinus angustifolius]